MATSWCRESSASPVYQVGRREASGGLKPSLRRAADAAEADGVAAEGPFTSGPERRTGAVGVVGPGAAAGDEAGVLAALRAGAAVRSGALVAGPPGVGAPLPD